MNCIEPGATSADDLLALACGEPREVAARHVEACPACAAIASSYAATDRYLAATLRRIDCPAALELGELALTLLDASRALELRAHLSDCPLCTAEFATLATDLRGDPLTALAATPGLLRRILASLAPTRNAAMLAGIRGESGGARVFQAEQFTISLVDQSYVQGAERSWSLIGLIDSPHMEPTEPIEAALSTSGALVSTAQIDEIGNFTFDRLTAGRYRLELRFPDRIIELEHVMVGAESDGT